MDRFSKIAAPIYDTKKKSQNKSGDKSDELDHPYWRVIDKFHWIDKSDGELQTSIIKNILAMMDMMDFTNFVDRRVNALAQRFDKEEVQHNPAMLSHIVARGKKVYLSMLTDPHFAEYLSESDDYRSLYDFMTPLGHQEHPNLPSVESRTI